MDGTDFFSLESWRLIVERRQGAVITEAVVRLVVRGTRITAAAEGTGPASALRNALRTALQRACPDRDDWNTDDWNTVDVHDNIIAASWLALEQMVTDSLLLAGHEHAITSGRS